MIIIFTKAELLDFVNSRFATAGQRFDEVRIVNSKKEKTKASYKAYAEQIQDEVCKRAGVSYVCPPDKKIACIKAVREAVPGLGLAEAKNIVENWHTWMSKVKETGNAAPLF